MSEIVEGLANMIHKRKSMIFREENRRPKLVVYMRLDCWYEMMKSLQINFLEDELFISHGKSIMGCKIYKLDDEDHPEVVIYEDAF